MEELGLKGPVKEIREHYLARTIIYRFSINQICTERTTEYSYPPEFNFQEPTETIFYDSNERVIKFLSNDNLVSSSEYDDVALTFITQTDDSKKQTGTLDAHGNIISRSSIEKTSTREIFYSYDSKNNLIKVTTKTNNSPAFFGGYKLEPIRTTKNKYDDKNQITYSEFSSISTTNENVILSNQTKFYNDNLLIRSEMFLLEPNKAFTTLYEYPEIDIFGNWTKRLEYSSTQEKPEITTRQITYYED